MRKILCFLCILLLGFGMVGVAHGTLFDRGGGLIYDSDQNITWLQDANYAQTSGYDSDGRMFWDNAVAWADQLEFQGYKDWRLPTSVAGPDVFSYDGTTTVGYNITNSEMGYMYYVNLGNLGYYATDGTNPQSGWSPTPNNGPFTNLQSVDYWSGTEHFNNPFYAGYFDFPYGYQGVDHKDVEFWVWAVRPGDSAPAVAPEPATMLLLGTGLAGLGVFRKRWRSHG